jgi:hypothetical protein
MAADFCLVVVVRGQYVLTPPADFFYKRSPGMATQPPRGGCTTTRTP